MASRPQPTHMGCRAFKIRLTEVFRLWGQRSMGPRGVCAQSYSRIRRPNSPPPASHQSDEGAAASVGAAVAVGFFVITASIVGSKSFARVVLQTNAAAPTSSDCL